MQERIALSDDKKTIFLGACQIYGSYIRRDGAVGNESSYMAKAVSEAIRLAKLVDSETCTEGEICDRPGWQDR